MVADVHVNNGCSLLFTWTQFFIQSSNPAQRSSSPFSDSSPPLPKPQFNPRFQIRVPTPELSSMREALEEAKENAVVVAVAKEKALVSNNGNSGGGGKNGGGGGGGNDKVPRQSEEETAREIQVVRKAYRREMATPA